MVQHERNHGASGGRWALCEDSRGARLPACPPVPSATVHAHAEGPQWAQAAKMPPPRAVYAGRGHDHKLYFFLPWVLPGILVSRILAVQERWARAPGGRRWSSLATVEQPRTAQRRPSLGVIN
jgi:hypothetical protein